MSERLWNKRVLGRVTTVHCRKCSAPIRLDGRDGGGFEDEQARRADSLRELRDELRVPAVVVTSASATSVAGHAVQSSPDQDRQAPIAKPVSVSAAPASSPAPAPREGASTATRTLGRPDASPKPPVVPASKPLVKTGSFVVPRPAKPVAFAARVPAPSQAAATAAATERPVVPRTVAVGVREATRKAAVGVREATHKAAVVAAEPARKAAVVARRPTRPVAVDVEKASRKAAVVKAEPARKAAVVTPEATGEAAVVAAEPVRKAAVVAAQPKAPFPPPAAPRVDIASSKKNASHENVVSAEGSGAVPTESADAESVPSLRALVVASPASDAEGEPPESSAPGEPLFDPSPPRIESRRAPEAGGAVRPKARPRRLAVYGTVLAALAAAALFFIRVAPHAGGDERQSAKASEVMATPLEPAPAEAVDPVSPPELATKPVVPSGSNAAEPEHARESMRAAHDEQRARFALRWARKRALACHLGGRAVGTVNVDITFAPEGKVKKVVLHGDPVASAPVGRCIESYFEAMLIPAYAGEPFTLHEQLTLR